MLTLCIRIPQNKFDLYSICFVTLVMSMFNLNLLAMRVKNINGTSQNTCRCGTWLQHWRNLSGQYTVTCRALGCSRIDISGAHVQKDNSDDNRWYIVPFCVLHNRASHLVELEAGTALVSANKKETCEK